MWLPSAYRPTKGIALPPARRRREDGSFDFVHESGRVKTTAYDSPAVAQTIFDAALRAVAR